MAVPIDAADFDRYEQARRRAAQLRGFYIHVLVLAFALGNTANFIINVMTRSPGDSWWFQWVLLVRGVALAVHGITVIRAGVWLGPKWEERKIRQYMSEADRPRRNESAPSVAAGSSEPT
jgi:2TM domain-containing protein